MLSDIKFDTIYSSGGTKSTPRDFFTLALSNSISFDIGLGFFSTASFNVLSIGFAKFISNGGTMRLYINQYLSEEDYAAISVSQTESFEKSILEDFEKMKSVLSKRDEHFFNCLSYLISNKRIVIKVIIPKSGGIAHQKIGVFTDSEGNKVAFNGSTNFSASAIMSRNIEATSCLCSWEGCSKHVYDTERIFNQYFEGNIPDVTVIEASKLEESIVKSFPPKDMQELLENEKEYINNVKKTSDGYFNPEATQYDPLLPHFPYSTGPRQYQVEAYNSWVSHNFKGIFAMATGTGKTITSLNCVLQEYQKTNKYTALILVPTNDLVEQWIEEVHKFNFSEVFVVNKDSKWKEGLTCIKNDLKWGIEHDFVIISTYKSFTNPIFLSLFQEMSNSNTIIIADEAHNVGSTNVRVAFHSLSVQKRIALSATPSRAYDENGTKAIEDFFDDVPPYCYSFSMERAIQEGYLMEYLYYPRIVYLDKEEMKRYAQITKQLLKYYDSRSKSFQTCSEVEELLMKRKRIIHKAKDKYEKFGSIIDELVSVNKYRYCFVYAPEGKDYSSEDQGRILQHLRDIVSKKYPWIDTNSFVGGDSDKKDKLRAFAEGKLDMLFAMKCLDEGVDVPRAEVGIFTSSTGNPRQFIQRRGRLLRKHKDKTFASIYDLIVVPDFRNNTDLSTFEMEKSLVKNELTRVAYFASLASNYYEATEILEEITKYYKFEISALIESLQIQ